MNRIEILKSEIKNLEKDKSTQSFMKLINSEKIDVINEQLEIIKKRLEIMNILLEEERRYKIVQDIIDRPLTKNEAKQKSIIDMLKANEHHLSPTVLSMYPLVSEVYIIGFSQTGFSVNNSILAKYFFLFAKAWGSSS